MCCACMMPVDLRASREAADTLSVRLHFPQGSAIVDSAVVDNGAVLRRLRSALGRGRAVAGVTVSGSASPEGSREFNNSLAAKRAQSLARMFPDVISVSVDTAGIDWPMLARLVGESDAERRADALRIIGRYPAADPSAPLRRLRGGRAWSYMLGHLFPAMRYADCRVTFAPEPDPVVAAEPDTLTSETADELPADTGVVAEAAPVARVTPGPRSGGVKVALTTNMLYDAALIPDLGVEIAFGSRWSLAADGMYAWWSKSSRSRFWRVYGGNVELRRWWPSGDVSLTGHHAGAYFSMLTYDFKLGRHGYLGDRWSYAAGLSYGYSVALSRYFNIDFSIGLGYLWGKYKKYHREDDCYVWERTSRRHWFGPTKAGVTLVYIIGGKSMQKGGAR